MSSVSETGVEMTDLPALLSTCDYCQRELRPEPR